MAGIKEARLSGHVPEQVGLEGDVVVLHLLLPINHCHLVLFAQEGVHHCDDSLCIWLCEDMATSHHDGVELDKHAERLQPQHVLSEVQVLRCMHLLNRLQHCRQGVPGSCRLATQLWEAARRRPDL